jgi:Astacin (Peptidase family M12A)
MILYEECGRGNMIHEFLHALGFLHMHTAVERDKFVSIQWDNVMEQSKMNFVKYTQHVSMFGTEYDYGSIMHYGDKAFAKDKSQPSIRKLKSSHVKMGQRKCKSH